MCSDTVNVEETHPCVCLFCSLVLCDILSAVELSEITRTETGQVTPQRTSAEERFVLCNVQKYFPSHQY